jgi:hypothetical protein
MAEIDTSDPLTEGQILRADLRGCIRDRVRQDLGVLSESVDDLRGLADALDEHMALPLNASGDQLRQAAADVRAIAERTLACASKASDVATRFSAWARVAGVAQLGE